MGALIQSVDRDDHMDACKCGIFPVVNCISAGIEGLPNPIAITTCRNFGRTSKDHIKSNHISKYNELVNYNKENDYGDS